MKRLIGSFLVCLWIGVFAQAQSEIEFFGGGYSPGTDVQNVDFNSGALLGVRLGHSFVKIFGTEFSYTFIKDLEDPQQNFSGNAHLLNGNFVLQIPVAHVVPFGTVGIGGIVGKSNNLVNIRSAFAWNAGGGLKLRQLLGPLGLRFDVRYFGIPDGFEVNTTNFKSNFHYVEGSAGLLLTF